MDFEALVEKARRHNAEFDAVDRKHGNKTPAEAGPRESMRCAIAALEAGIKMANWDCIAEALVMLYDADQSSGWS
jgi:hypothetical protein